MLTDERVAEIRARLEAATPGPWEPDQHPNPVYEWRVCPVDPARQPYVIAAEATRADAAFIAAAPTDLADLLRHADALAQENRRLRAALEEIAAAIREAVAAEREEAAKVAEAETDFDGLIAAKAAGMCIARAIRARSEP